MADSKAEQLVFDAPYYEAKVAGGTYYIGRLGKLWVARWWKDRVPEEQVFVSASIDDVMKACSEHNARRLEEQ